MIGPEVLARLAAGRRHDRHHRAGWPARGARPGPAPDPAHRHPVGRPRCSALLGLAGWLLLGTGVLGVHDVQVTGTSRLDPAEVRSVAAIEAGTPLARLDTGAVADRLRRLPVVRTVDVERSWPRGVTIRVRERTAAAVQARGPAYVLVDREGVAFAPVQRRPAGLPLVSAPVDAGPPALRAALDVLDQLTGPVRDQVRQVRAATAEQVELAADPGPHRAVGEHRAGGAQGRRARRADQPEGAGLRRQRTGHARPPAADARQVATACRGLGR